MKTKNKSIDDRKLTDRLSPADEFGAYEGFWATTYDLNTEFFETDFLPALLDLGSWDDRHWTSRIALERKLAYMSSATVLMDAARYPGRPRSLRVDLLPDRGTQNNALHAKVLLLVQEKGVLLLVGSSNLTEHGYRHNIEVSACLSASKRNPAHATLIKAALETAPDILAPWWGASLDGLTRKAMEVLQSIPVTEKPTDCWFAWSGGETSLLEQFLAQFPPGARARRISIVSPFWSEEDGHGPVATLLRRLKDRNGLDEGAEVNLIASPTQVREREYLPSLPTSYGCFDFGAHGVRAKAYSASPEVLPEEVMGREISGARALHAKVVLIECEGFALGYLGSANFTHKGWGILKNPATANIEGGIILLRRGKAADELRALLPKTIGSAVELAGAGNAKLAPPLSEQEEAKWPTFLIDARLTPNSDRRQELELVVRVRPDRVQGAWSLVLPPEGDSAAVSLLSHETGQEALATYRIWLSQEHLRRLLTLQEVQVVWWGCQSGRSFPINIAPEARDELPIAPGYAKLEERLLLAYYQGRIAYEELFPPIDPDPSEKKDFMLESEASGVDTSGIQSYQIRDFVESLDGIRSDLRQACSSERTMRLALLGPVSPVELARCIYNSIEKGERTVTAGGFQLVEILACLQETRSLAGHERWEKHRESAAAQVMGFLDNLRQTNPTDLGPKTVFDQYANRIVAFETKAASI
jgi:hypothetical protein